MTTDTDDGVATPTTVSTTGGGGGGAEPPGGGELDAELPPPQPDNIAMRAMTHIASMNSLARCASFETFDIYPPSAILGSRIIGAGLARLEEENFERAHRTRARGI